MSDNEKMELKTCVDIGVPNKFEHMFPINGKVKANAYTKDIFEERTAQVFEVLWNILSKSFGPFGAPTIISQYPYYHVTKDGYTIFKNTNLDTTNTIVDKVIAGMVMDICGRLNNTVGDGTTTAVIATNMIYKGYQEYKEYFKENLILPRNIIKRFEVLRDEIIDMLKKESISIQSDDMDVLRENIYRVAYISSNADEKISSMIADLYKELGCPKITPILAPDGVTKSYLIDGYQIGVKLLDRMYINSDDNTANYKNLDVIMFDHKVTLDTYNYILKPLVYESRSRERHLLCIAPSYDSIALDSKIAVELNNEYGKTRDVSLILTSIFTSSNLSKSMMNDLAMLLNTRIITLTQERNIIEKMSTTEDFCLLNQFNMDSRHIPGINIAYVSNHVGNRIELGLMKDDGYGVDDKIKPYGDLEEDCIRIGFVREASCGLDNSTFSGFEYDEKQYKNYIDDAEENLKKAIQKYSKLGTFNLDISNAQKRLHSLKMKMGVIEVGGTSDLSQKLLKDSVDDTVKACESAYEHGIIRGCNVTTLKVLYKLIALYEVTEDSERKELSLTLINILVNGFRSVYKTVLSNAFEDMTISIDHIDNVDECIKKLQMNAGKVLECNFDTNIMYQAIKTSYDEKNLTYDLYDIIINYSIISDTVYDLESFSFSDSIINSMETDKEVLNATSDLISLLIAGNQLIINAYRD